jgi:hypothetical protein
VHGSVVEVDTVGGFVDVVLEDSATSFHSLTSFLPAGDARNFLSSW